MVSGMRRTNDFIFRQLQALTKYTHQCRIEGQRASFKNYRRRDVQTLRQTADGLLGNRMKRRQRNIFPCTARIEHRLNICFGEHAASSADAVHGFSLTGKRLKALCRCLEQRCNLINKCACTARTAAVHAHIARDELSCVFIVLEKDNLCVLSAQFNRRARLRIQMPHRRCIGNNLPVQNGYPYSRQSACRRCRKLRCGMLPVGMPRVLLPAAGASRASALHGVCGTAQTAVLVPSGFTTAAFTVVEPTSSPSKRYSCCLLKSFISSLLSLLKNCCTVCTASRNF